MVQPGQVVVSPVVPISFNAVVFQCQHSSRMSPIHGIKEKYDIRYIDYGFPGVRFGWNIIDSHTNQMVWRGYDTQTIDFDKSDKTIHKSVEKLVKQFQHDVTKQKKNIR